jgi:ribosome maturation factor RimP
MENVPIAYGLRASIQRALLGEVDTRMVAVTCGVVGSTIIIRSYVDGPVTAADIERIQVVSTEVITDFMDDGYTIEEECLPVGSTKPECLDFWAFYRADDKSAKS